MRQPTNNPTELATAATKPILTPWYDGKDTETETHDLSEFVRAALIEGVAAGIHPIHVIDGLIETIEIPWEEESAHDPHICPECGQGEIIAHSSDHAACDACGFVPTEEEE